MFVQLHAATIRDMTPLIAMPASQLPATGGAIDAGRLPELPVLSALLRGATRLPPRRDWRDGVLDALSIRIADGAGPAAVAACAIDVLAPGGSVCLAAPVHAVAGVSRMFLATGDSFAIDAAETEALRLAFNAEFGAPHIHLHAVGTGWVLQAPCAVAASDGSPELLAGAALAREPARTAEGRALRRLGAEVEMWLAGLPLNRERESRGAAPVNCFWFWGGTASLALTGPMHRPGVLVSNLGPDVWMAGLARLCGLRMRRAGQWSEVGDSNAAVTLLQPSASGNALQHLPAWEAAWFEPVRRDLAARRLPALRLQIGGDGWLLPAPRLARWLHRPRPWWEALSA